MSVRISATDWVEGGIDGADAVGSRGPSTAREPTSSRFGRARRRRTPGRSTAACSRRRSRTASATRRASPRSPSATSPSRDQVNSIIAAGRADLCALARPHLADPNWTLRAAAQLGYNAQPWPVQYLSGQAAARTETAQRPSRAEGAGARTIREDDRARSRQALPASTEGHRIQPRHFGWSVDGSRGHRDARPARAQESAHLRVLPRAGRHLPRPRDHARRRGGRAHRRRRELLLGRRRPEIIGPLVEMRHADDPAEFTRLTGELVNMRRCPQPIVAAVDGICAGAGAILAMASDLRLGTPRSGWPSCSAGRALRRDMGACAILPRIIGQGRAAELLYTGRPWKPRRPSAGASTTAWSSPRPRRAAALARRLADGPDLRARDDQASSTRSGTWGSTQAIEAEAQAQAICMQTEDFARAYRAFAGQGETGLRRQLMPDRSFLDWPFFEDAHRELARDLDAWCDASRAPAEARGRTSTAAAARSSGRSAKAAGCATRAAERLDVRSLCLIRETLARTGIADFAFALQGLGSAPISLFGSEERSAAGCRGWPPARRSPLSRSRKPKPARTSPPCPPPRGATATPG